MAAPRLLVVMLNWNASAMTLGGLDDLLGWEYPLDRVSLLVHDNASKDGDWQAVAERVAALDGRRGLRAVFRRFAAHPGVTASFNAALAEAASADYVVRLDNDVRLDPQAAGRLVAFMEANPTAGVCAPLLRVGGPEGPPLSGPVRFDPARGSVCQPVTGAVPVACDLVDGAVMLARRAALDGLGQWFDPDLFLFHEEEDLCLRLDAAGWRSWFVPEAGGVAFPGTSTGRTPWLSQYLDHRNRILVMHLLGSRWRVGLGQLRHAPRILARSVRRRCSAPLLGFLAGLLGIRHDAAWWRRKLGEG